MTTDLFIPVLSHFENENPWLASAGRLRCRVLPAAAEENPQKKILMAEVWEGPWAYEFSTVEETREFPLSEEGLQALSVWLEHWREIVEARPSRSLAENIARRNAVQSAEK